MFVYLISILFGVISLSKLCASTNLRTENEGHHRAAASSQCRREIFSGLERGEFLNQSLANYDAYATKLNSFLISSGGGFDGEGNSGDKSMTLERQLYAYIASKPCIKTICEIGFNAGHSTLNWMIANPTARVIMFDLWEHKVAATAEEFLRSQPELNPSRLDPIVKGNSQITVKGYHTEHPNVHCDLVSVDGGHTFDLAVGDIDNMQTLANPKSNILLIDDTRCNANWCVDAAVKEHLKLGTIKFINGWPIGSDDKRGVSVFTYTRNENIENE